MREHFTREDALAEGRLLDVSHLNREGFHPFPTFVSVGLWEACRREGPGPFRKRYRSPQPSKRVSQEERIRQVITLLTLLRWLQKGKCGEYTTYFDSSLWLREPLALRVVVEPDEVHGRVVTILLEDERLEFHEPPAPHGGSFFIM